MGRVHGGGRPKPAKGAALTDTTIASIDLDPAALGGQPGDSLAFTAQARNAAGQALPGKVYTATSSDEAVVTVAVVGAQLLLTVLTEGSATITAHSAGIDSAARPVVSAYVLDHLTLTPTSLSMAAGDFDTLTVSAFNRYDVELALPALVGFTSDPAIATVDETPGETMVVSGVSAGAVIVRVSAGAIASNTVPVTVTESAGGFAHFDRAHFDPAHFDPAHFL